MTTHNSYAEVKIANPYSEIFCSIGGDFAGIERVSLVALSGVKEGWNKCNPSDHCSALKEFLDAGFKLVEGDKYLEVVGYVYTVEAEDFDLVNKKSSEDCDRYILSAAALNGGCNIPAKVEQWTIYNNTFSLSELNDERRGMLFNHHCNGGVMQNSQRGVEEDVFYDTDSWSVWSLNTIYRAKPKSERELFIDAAVATFDGRTGLSESAISLAAQLMFDSKKFKYVDLTNGFGESVR